MPHVFPYLDDWLIKNLFRNRLITQTRFCIQIIQSLGFLPNLKKSDLFPSQKFTFIGMEFLSQQNLVRVPTDCSDNQEISVIQTCIRTNFPFLFGQTQCCSRLRYPRQTALTSPSDVSFVCLETSYSSSPSSYFDKRYDSISQWWMNPNWFETGTTIHSPDSKFFLYMDARHYPFMVAGQKTNPSSISIC